MRCLLTFDGVCGRYNRRLQIRSRNFLTKSIRIRVPSPTYSATAWHNKLTFDDVSDADWEHAVGTLKAVYDLMMGQGSDSWSLSNEFLMLPRFAVSVSFIVFLLVCSGLSTRGEVTYPFPLSRRCISTYIALNPWPLESHASQDFKKYLKSTYPLSWGAAALVVQGSHSFLNLYLCSPSC